MFCFVIFIYLKNSQESKERRDSERSLSSKNKERTCSSRIELRREGRGFLCEFCVCNDVKERHDGRCERKNKSDHDNVSVRRNLLDEDKGDEDNRRHDTKNVDVSDPTAGSRNTTEHDDDASKRDAHSNEIDQPGKNLDLKNVGCLCVGVGVLGVFLVSRSLNFRIHFIYDKKGTLVMCCVSAVSWLLKSFFFVVIVY